MNDSELTPQPPPPLKPGMRLACATCGTQVVLVRPQGPELSCCGAPLGLPS